ncbi:MAG: hypothetical protein ACFB0G_18790 [Leptolyngbyaceae cyanobacterium]
MAFRHTLLWSSSLFWLVACSTTSPPPPTAEPENTPPPVAEQSAPLDSTASSTPAPTAVPPSPAPPDNPITATTLETPVALSSAAIATDTAIIPGERVGLVTQATSRTELATLFGEAALLDTEVHIGEGFTEPGTAVNAATPAAFSVIWADNDQSQTTTVRDFGPDWQTPEGLRVGMPFAELQSVLGDFDLYGFGWDYGGTIVLERSNLSNYDGLIVLRLEPTKVDTFQQQPEAFQALQGDHLISSDNPYLSALDLVVYEMIVYLDAPL